MDKSYLLYTTKYDRHASVFVSTLAKVEYSVNSAVITIQLWWWWWNWEYSGTFSIKYEEKARFSSEMQNISLEIKMIKAKFVHTCCNDGIFLALSCIKAFFAVYFSLFYRTLAFSLILLNQITKRCEWSMCVWCMEKCMYTITTQNITLENRFEKRHDVKRENHVVVSLIYLYACMNVYVYVCRDNDSSPQAFFSQFFCFHKSPGFFFLN